MTPQLFGYRNVIGIITAWAASGKRFYDKFIGIV